MVELFMFFQNLDLKKLKLIRNKNFKFFNNGNIKLKKWKRFNKLICLKWKPGFVKAKKRGTFELLCIGCNLCWTKCLF